MTLSINTNVGAFVALQQLTKTTNQLEQTQLRITTGLRVNGPKGSCPRTWCRSCWSLC